MFLDGTLQIVTCNSDQGVGLKSRNANADLKISEDTNISTESPQARAHLRWRRRYCVAALTRQMSHISNQKERLHWRFHAFYIYIYIGQALSRYSHYDVRVYIHLYSTVSPNKTSLRLEMISSAGMALMH